MSLASYYEKHYGECSEIERLRAQLAELQRHEADYRAYMERELVYWRSLAKGVTFVVDRGQLGLEVFQAFHPLDQERLARLMRSNEGGKAR